MKILVFGNIGSGKTTFCTALSKKLEGWEYLAVDDFRRTFSDGTMKADSVAKSAFVKSVSHDNRLQIIESSGFGRLGSSLHRRLQKYEGNLIVLVLVADLEICLKRLEKRIWDVPFPENTTRGNELVKKMDKQIFSNFLFDRWGTRNNTFFLQVPNNTMEDSNAIISAMDIYIHELTST